MFDDIVPENAPFDGRWWSPEDLSEIVGGRIGLIDGIWELSLNGWLGPWARGSIDNPIPTVIHGLIGTNRVTLLDLVVRNAQGSIVGRPFRTRINCNVVLIGVHGSKDLKFTRASVRHHNIDEWANRSPWTTTFGGGSVPFEATIAYKDPGEISSPISGANVSLTRSIQLLDNLSKAEMRSWEWIDFEFEMPLDLAEIENGYVRPLGQLLELAANDSCPLLGFNLVPEIATTPHESVNTLSALYRGTELIPIPEIATTPHESVKVLSALHRGGELTPKHSFRFNFNLSDIRFEEVI
ncbi:MAG: ApeA N-terminal domain 1-containing protein, partial [Sulfobacillus sp.]